MASSNQTTLERAFELARTGRGIGDIRTVLDAEGFTLSQLDGSPSLRLQLRRLRVEAENAKNPELKMKRPGRPRMMTPK